MLTLYLSESYAKLLVRLRKSVANAIIGTELRLITLPHGTSSLRADPSSFLKQMPNLSIERLSEVRRGKASLLFYRGW